MIQKDKDTLSIHGVLDDDIYSLEIDVVISISDLEITFIQGKWGRQENVECPRAIPFLQEAVGFHIDEGFSQKVQKTIGRKACRHFSDILIECCNTAKETVLLLRWEEKKTKIPGLSLDEFLSKVPEDSRNMTMPHQAVPEQETSIKRKVTPLQEKKVISGGMIIDLHTHTSQFSPCSSAPVDELIEEAKRIGLDGICLTDHNHIWDAGDAAELNQGHDFLVLRGNEITTDQGDMLVFGLEKEIKDVIKLGELRKLVIKADGFIIAAHPFRGFLTFGVGQLGLTPEKAMDRPLFKSVDALEVLNSKVTPKENSFAAEVATGLGLPATGGSDAHEVGEVGIYATHFSDVIKNEDDLINALKKGDYSPVVFRRLKGREG